jgi:O-antigen ligase
MGLLLASKPQAFPYLVGAALVVCATSLNPMYSLAALLLLAPLDINSLFGNGAIGGINISDGVVFLLIAGAALRCLLKGELRLNRTIVWCVVLGIVIFVGTVPAVFVDTTAGLKFIGQVAAPILAYLVARHARFPTSDDGAVRLGVRAIYGSLVFALLLTGATVALGRSIETFGGEHVTRFAGPLGSGSLAFFLLPPLVLAMAALSVRLTGGRLFLLAALGLPLMATVTRSALLAAAVAVLYFGISYGTRGQVALLVVICLLLGTAFVAVAPNSLNRFRATNNVSQRLVEGNVTARKLLWNFIWRTDVRPSPIVGSGLGATAPIFAGQTTFHSGAGAVHNDYLYIWAQVGLLGLVGYLSYVLSLLVRGIRREYRDRRHVSRQPPWTIIVRRAAPPIIITYLIVSYTDNVLANFAHFGIPAFILVGLAARRRGESATQSPAADTTDRWVASTAAEPDRNAGPGEGTRFAR